jgi:two-component system, NtrC family, response regulator AtoC
MGALTSPVMTQETRTLDVLALDKGESGPRAFLIVSLGKETRIVPLLEGEAITVGRARSSTIHVDDEHISRLHSSVVRRGDDIVVTDLGSRNGTIVGGARIERERRVLAGDVISIGPLTAVVAVAAAPAAAATPATESAPSPGTHVIADPAMARVYELCRRVAATPLSVLVSGETGAGKENVAEAIHRFGPRADRPFVRLHIASLPETLLESELFGHEKGAFTGASKRRIGYFESAAGGTLFLDEIGELPLATQAKLLRTLETRQIVRIGSTEEVPVDVRIVAATNRDLPAEVRAGRFREDLFFRLSAFRIDVPPLRARPVEIPLLASLFAREIAERMAGPAPVLRPEVLAALQAYAWPGNVRELKHTMEAAYVLAAPGDIRPEHLPEPLRQGSTKASAAARPAAADEGADLPGAVSETERRAILAALTAHGGNQTRAAAQLGISRRGLIYKMSKYDIHMRRTRE